MRSSALHARVGRTLTRELRPICEATGEATRASGSNRSPASLTSDSSNRSSGSKRISWRRESTGSSGMQVLHLPMAAARWRSALAWLGRLLLAPRATVCAPNQGPAQRLSGVR